jgi:glycosyltransferase 2 family protein
LSDGARVATVARSLAGHGSPARGAARRRWRLVARVASIAFFFLVLFAIGWYARSIEWAPVLESLRAYRPATLALAALAAAASCLTYASFDLLSRPHGRHGPSWRWVLPVAFTAFTFNLNLGPWIGSLGMRLRQYTRLGVGSAQVLRIILFSTLTNWVGYVTLAGLVFAVAPPKMLPEDWPIGQGALRLAGCALLAAAAAYWAACAWARKRVYSIRKASVRLPSGRLALLQMGLAGANWALAATVPWLLLGGAVGYPLVLATMLLAAVAGAALHIPGGVGVVEAVMLGVLGNTIPHGPLLATLLVYRATYYLWPFALGLVAFFALEAAIRKRGPRTP